MDRGHAKYVDGDNGQVQMLQCNALGLHLKAQNRNNPFLAANAIRGSNLKYLPHLSSAVRPFRQILLRVLIAIASAREEGLDLFEFSLASCEVNICGGLV